MIASKGTSPATQESGQRRFVLVTGPSGAGRSSTLKILEDLGFEAIDNLPLRLLDDLLADPDHGRSLALGIDLRNRDFSAQAITARLAKVKADPNWRVDFLYLDCSVETLLRRFSETRRRHPLAQNGRPEAGIRRELAMLDMLRTQADLLVDTSQLTVHDLRAEVEKWFAPDGKHPLAVSVQSFSYKRGLPMSVDTVFDCRFLRNPFWQADLRDSNGTQPDVAAFVSRDPNYESFTDKVFALSAFLLPAYQNEGKSHVSIAFGCTGGQHRSVAVAQDHASRLEKLGWQVSIRHRELDRQQSSTRVFS
ncbi:MAG: RNase adapter RapZ [Pseudomonadota bacterium]